MITIIQQQCYHQLVRFQQMETTTATITIPQHHLYLHYNINLLVQPMTTIYQTINPNHQHQTPNWPSFISSSPRLPLSSLFYQSSMITQPIYKPQQQPANNYHHNTSNNHNNNVSDNHQLPLTTNASPQQRPPFNIDYTTIWAKLKRDISRQPWP